MTMHSIPIARCPYCETDGGGHILVDVAAIEKLRAAHVRRSIPEEIPGHVFLLFNTASEARGPCEHALLVSGAIEETGHQEPTRVGKSGWGRYFHCSNPRLDDLKSGGSAEIYLLETLPCGLAPDTIRPSVDSKFTFFEEKWTSVSTEGGTFWKISGSVYFAEDVEALIAESHELGARYREWRAERKPSTARKRRQDRSRDSAGEPSPA